MLRPVTEYDCLVLGCGNVLVGDDGFGPAVIQHLEAHHPVPDSVALIDCGTSIRDILFDIILAPRKPRRVIIVDVTDSGSMAPGDIREIDIDQIRPEKRCDFALHQFPGINLLKEIKDETQVDISVFVAQVAAMPSEVKPGLSETMRRAVPAMCNRVLSAIGAPPTAPEEP
jgi:coenzyme F420 hydrogenase subunit delta